MALPLQANACPACCASLAPGDGFCSACGCPASLEAGASWRASPYQRQAQGAEIRLPSSALALFFAMLSVSCYGLPGVAGIIISAIALGRIRRQGQRHSEQSLFRAALWLSAGGLALWVVLFGLLFASGGRFGGSGG